ncbi:MAG: hypothetical protein ACI8VW_002445, partial [bacterium]
RQNIVAPGSQKLRISISKPRSWSPLTAARGLLASSRATDGRSILHKEEAGRAMAAWYRWIRVIAQQLEKRYMRSCFDLGIKILAHHVRHFQPFGFEHQAGGNRTDFAINELINNIECW